MGPGGALDTLIEAKEEGLVRFLGVTGNNWTIASMHKRSLRRFDLDSALFPCNYLMLKKARYQDDFEQLLAVCEERNVALQTIKSIARGPWATHERDRKTWYQPLEDQEDIDRAVSYVLGIPGVFLNTVGEINLLPRVLDAASRFRSRPSDEEMEAMLEGQNMTSIFGI